MHAPFRIATETTALAMPEVRPSRPPSSHALTRARRPQSVSSPTSARPSSFRGSTARWAFTSASRASASAARALSSPASRRTTSPPSASSCSKPGSQSSTRAPRPRTSTAQSTNSQPTRRTSRPRWSGTGLSAPSGVRSTRFSAPRRPRRSSKDCARSRTGR